METVARMHHPFHMYDAILAQAGAFAQTVGSIGGAAEVPPRKGRTFPPHKDAGVTGRVPLVTTSPAPLAHATRVDDPKGAT